MYPSLGPLGLWLGEIPWPVDFFSPDDLPGFLNTIFVQNYELDMSEQGFFSEFWLAFANELGVSLPGLSGVKLMVGSTDPGYTFLSFSLSIGSESVLTLDNLQLALRFDPTILKPAALNPGDPAPQFVEIQVAGSVGINSFFDVNVQGFDAFKLTPAMIGDTGIIIAADDVKLDLSRTTNIPEVTAAGFDSGFMGVYIGQAQVKLPDGLPALAPEDLFLKNCAIGTGGVSGRLEAHYTPVYDSVHKTFTGKGAGDLFGIPFGLKDAILDIKQNTFQESILSGSILLPFFDELVDVALSINQNGTLSAKLTAPGGLYTLTKPGILSLQLESISFVLQQSNFITKLSGQITPLIGAPALNWPSFAIKELSIDLQGHVHIQGGWLNLPNQYHLNFYGFTLQIDKLGFGADIDGGRWIGFNGGLKLVDGMPAGASVNGLRLTWYEDGRAPQVNLNGVSVELTVPNALRLKGSVSYSSDQNEFHGSITLNLMALHMEVDGSAVFGTRAGHTYLALYLDAEWPAGVPLFATGLGLYGMAGLLVLNMAPNKLSTEEWYGSDTTPGWYLRSPVGIVQSIGALPSGNQAKWVDQVGATAFGAGVTLGTLGDNGHSFSGRLLVALFFPGPVVMIEGKASLLQDRATLDKDANFRALAVLDSHAGTFQAHLDARYRYDGSGKLITIRGGAEAFFSLSDAHAWHLYLGQKDPRAQRIRAQIFQLFEADAYVMLDSHQLAMGAWVGYNHQWSFGPLSVTLQAWLDSNAVISWHPVHFHGDLWLHGSIVLAAFGISLGLTVDARLAADVFDPFHILGQFSVSLSLPWPLPSPSATVTMEWGPTPTVPALPLPLQEVAVEHFKTTASWPLPGGVLLSPPSVPPQASIPVVPLDSRPHVTFSRPVNDDALVGVNVQPLVPPTERIGDPSQNQGPLTVRYGLKQIVLQKQQGNSWVTVAQAPDSGRQRLYGSWATVPRMPSGGGPNPGQTKLWLWSKSAFDYTRHTSGEWNQWFTDRFSGYPCGPLVQNCWDFDQVAPTTGLPNPWHHPAQPNLVFSNDANGSLSIVTLNQPVEGLAHALCFTPGSATINLPEPRNVVKIPALDTYPSYAAFYGYDAQGNAYGPFTKSSGEQTTIEIRGGNMTRIGIKPATLAGPVGAAIGCAYVPSRSQLLFVEFGSGNLSAVDLSTNRYTVLGTGYMTPEDIVVTADGNTAYITERPGNLLRLDLNRHKFGRDSATLLSPGMTAPQQIALDEENNRAYVVEYADSGRLLRIDLSSGQQAVMYGGLVNAVGLLLLPGSSTVYITEQGGSQFSRVTFTPGSDTTHEVLLSGLTSPFFMHWGNANHTSILLALRDPANKIVQLDLTQSPAGLTTLVDNVPFRPSSAVLLPGNRLAVCSDSVVSGYDLQLCIPQICVVTADELIQHFTDELDHWSQQGNVFDPYTTYRLQVITTVAAHGDGELSWYQPPTQTYTDYAYFRTGGPPAVETLATPAGYSASAGPFKSGLEDLTRYVDLAAATPIPGAPGAYSVGISFNENYVDLLYSKAMRDLVIHLYDNNGPARDSNGRLITLGNLWGRVDQLTLTESEISWLATLSQGGCVLVDPQTILHNTQLLSPLDSQALAPQTLYEARLVPMLLREHFGEYPAGTGPAGLVNSLGRWNAQDTGSVASHWQTVQEGTPPASFLWQTAPATSTLLWTPNQPSDWSDSRLSITLRAAVDAPIGVVFRYQTGQFYRLSLVAQSPYWQLVRQDSQGTTTYPPAPSSTGKIFQTGVDYLVTIEAVGKAINIYYKLATDTNQDDILLFTLLEQSATSGTIGLYCENHPGARFTEVQVEDFRAVAPVAYKFSFITA